jgi:hypothetical protein
VLEEKERLLQEIQDKSQSYICYKQQDKRLRIICSGIELNGKISI